MRVILWALLLLGIALLGGLLQWHSYSIGAKFQIDKESPVRPAAWTVKWVVPEGPAERAGLRRDDRLLEVEGEPAAELSLPFGGRLAHFLTPSQLNNWLSNQAALYERVRQAGQVRILYERDGVTHPAELRPEPIRWRGIFGAGTIARALLAVVFLGAGWFVYRRHRSSKERRHAFSLCSSAAMLSLAWWPAYSENSLPETQLFLALFGAGNLASALTLASLISLMLYFPVARPLVRHVPWIAPALHVLCLLAALSLVGLKSPYAMWAVWTLGLPASIVLMVNGYLNAPAAVDRSRMEWLFIGLALSLMLMVMLYAPLVLLDTPEPFLENLVPLALLPLPFALGLAVESWKVTQVNRVLESVLTFVMAMLILSAVYAALISLLSHTHVPMGLYRRSVLVSGLAASGLVLAVLFFQREGLRAGARRLLRGPTRDLVEEVEKQRAQLFKTTDARQVGSLLMTGLRELFDPSWTAVLWSAPGQPSLAVRAVIPENSIGILSFLEDNFRVLEKHLQDRKKADLLAGLADLRDRPFAVSLDSAVAPMPDSEGRIAGILCAGPRRNRQIYDRESLTSLALLSIHAGLHLDTIRVRQAYETGLRREQMEREQMGREIHDSVGAELTNVILVSQSLRKSLSHPNGHPIEPNRLLELLEERARGALEDIRTATWALHTPESENDYLGWLKRYTADTTAPADLHLSFERTSPENVLSNSRPLTPSVRLHLFRILQEAVTNIIKHARASRVTVSWARDDRHIRLLIEDDGIGFDPAVPRLTSYGLDHVRQRARLLNGTVRIDSSPGHGTALEISVPVLPEEG